MVPVVGLEPTRVISPKDFESSSSTIPTHRQIYFLTPRQAFPGIWRDMQEGC